MYKRPLRSDELYHWGSKNGSHRYIAKIGEGKDARYFYTQEELQAYKNQKNNLSNTEKQVKLEEYQRATNGYRGKDKALGEVKFQRGEQRGMTKEDRDNLRNYWNDAENRKEFHDTHAADEEWYNKTKKKADKIAAKREKKARNEYGHTQEEMNARSKEARLEERGPRVAKTRSQNVDEARNEQRSSRSYESRSSAKESRIEERGPRVAKTKGQSAEDARNEQRSARSHENNSATRDRLRSAKENRSLNSGGSKSTVTSSKPSTSKTSSSPNLKDVADDAKKAVKNAADSISERAKSLKNVSEKAKRKAKKAKKKIDKFLNPGYTVEHHTYMGH